MLNGSAVALVTPMKSDGEIDWVRFGDLIEWQIDQGTEAIIPVGTTGESATVSMKEHFSLVKSAVEAAAGRVPVIAGTGANSTSEAIELTKAAKDSRADACLLVTPYYNKPTQSGLFKHFSEIARSVELPQILYNVPSRTGCDLLPETIAHLNESDLVIGIKEATGDLERAKTIMSGSGTISVTANVAPMKMAKMSEAALSGNLELAKNLDSDLRGLHRDLFLESNPIPVKWALHEMGKIENGIRLPMTELAPEHHRLLRESLLQAGAI